MIRVNPYCRDWGWLFEDLKVSLAVADVPGIQAVPSTDPLPGMDAYIAIRTGEALDSPDPARTVVQWHDLRDHPATWERLGEFGALQTVSDMQTLEGVTTHCYPIGARQFFTCRENLPGKFTLGWVGRDVVYMGRHIKRPQLFVDLILGLRLAGIEVEANFYGPAFGSGSLAPYAEQCDGNLTTGGRGQTLEAFYHGIDALVVTCEPEPGPLTIYESLRCGVPVITTHTGAAEPHYPGCYQRKDEQLPATALSLWRLREQNFHARKGISRAMDLTQEAWARFTLQLAEEVAR